MPSSTISISVNFLLLSGLIDRSKIPLWLSEVCSPPANSLAIFLVPDLPLFSSAPLPNFLLPDVFSPSLLAVCVSVFSPALSLARRTVLPRYSSVFTYPRYAISCKCMGSDLCTYPRCALCCYCMRNRLCTSRCGCIYSQSALCYKCMRSHSCTSTYGCIAHCCP